jgi:hypothetical protein
LDGSKSVDRTTTGKITNYQWTKIAGPASYTITSPSSAITNVTDLTEGSYTFRLTVTNTKGNKSYNNVDVKVYAGTGLEAITPTSSAITSTGELHFAKDFEGVTLSTKSNNTGMNFNNWGLNELPQCSASLNFVSGRTDLTPCQMVTDAGKRVLEMRVIDDDPSWSGTSRAQLDMSFDESVRSQEVIHISYRVKLHPDIAHMVNIPNFNNTWFTLQEFWYEGASGENPAGGGRVTVYIKEPVEGKLVLRAEMQRTPAPGVQNLLWRKDNTAYSIPFGVWATWDVYLRRGDKANGNYKLTITVDGQAPVTVFDVHDTTILPDAPTRRCNYVAPFKLYGGDVLYDAMRAANKNIQAWYNDFKWYKN